MSFDILNPGSIWVGGEPYADAVLTPVKWMHYLPKPNASKLRSIIRKVKHDGIYKKGHK